jgi:hypothetical protein
MSQQLGHYLNATVLVAIPSIFKDDEPRSCKLIGLEAAGLWLQSEELNRLLGSTGKIQVEPTTTTAFIPFSQIAYMLDPAQMIELQKVAQKSVEKVDSIDQEAPRTPSNKDSTRSSRTPNRKTRGKGRK